MTLKQDDRMHIFFASDNNFILPLTVSISSILRNSLKDDQFSFYILDKDISEKNKKRILKLKRIKDFDIEFIHVDDTLFKNCPLTKKCKHISLQTYYRYIIPSLKPNIEKVLYLDCDILVVSSLKSLWNTDLKDTYCGVVQDTYLKTQSDAARIGVSFYFNAGVLLINNRKWVLENIESKLFQGTEELFNNNNLIWQDQDVLNYVFNNNVTWLNPKYNFQQNYYKNYSNTLYTKEEMKEAEKNAVILHYNTSIKPWAKCDKSAFKKIEYIKEMFLDGFYKNCLKSLIKIFIRQIFYLGNCTRYGTKYRLLTILGVKIKIKYKKKIEDLLNEKFARLNYYNETLSVAQKLHQQVFSKYKNVNKGKCVVLVATGPSLNDFKPINDAIYLGVNKAFQYEKVKFDYLFLQDYSGPTPNYIDDFCKYNAKKFLGITSDYLLPQCIIPAKYGDFEGVERFCVAHPTEKSNFTYDISTLPFGDFYSIVFPAMQFLLWTNPSKIYLVGCDCNQSGYANSNQKNLLYINKVIDGWEKMKKFAKAYYPDTEIISINPVGLKGVFKDEYQ
jgi:lipopolysaccharide biosynthesis glycosyltransferase